VDHDLPVSAVRAGDRLDRLRTAGDAILSGLYALDQSALVTSATPFGLALP